MHPNIQKKPLKIGITGGIGSGKTTACQIFAALGIPVYYADSRAKWLMANHPPLREGIAQLFGAQAYLPDGRLNRAYIAQMAFADKALLGQLNALVHPVVGQDSETWHEQQKGPYTLKEAALLFESGSFRGLDAVIVVTAPEPLRVQRVMSRDRATEEQVQSRIRQQMPEQEKAALADFIIQNDGQQLLIPQVCSIHQQLLQRYDQI